MDIDKKSSSIVLISLYTATNNNKGLEYALYGGLENGMTINEIKEELCHLYSYCGWGNSIRGINLLKDVLHQRKAKGIDDPEGRDATPNFSVESRYEFGARMQCLITGLSEEQLRKKFDFCPLMDKYLKEHLFVDQFGRDTLTYKERELATVSALVATQDSFLSSHLHAALNVGISAEELRACFEIERAAIGDEQIEWANQQLDNVLLIKK